MNVSVETVSTLLLWLMEYSIRSSLLLIMAVVLFSMGFLPATIRKRFLSLTFAAILIMPLLTVTLPAFNIALLPAGAVDIPAGISNPAHTIVSTGSVAVADAPVPPDNNQSAFNPLFLVLILWASGFCYLLISYLNDLLAVRRVLKRCSRVASHDLTSFWNQLIARPGTWKPVILSSEEAEIAFSTGFLRRVIVLPADFRQWDADVLKNTLLHEYNHCRERDLLWQLPALLTTWLFWFNPLFWLARKRLRLLQEQSCDEFVLERGISPRSYAETLILMASRFRESTVKGALAMGSPGFFMRRLRSILQVSQQRRKNQMKRKVFFTFIFAAIVLVSATISPFGADGATTEAAAAASETEGLQDQVRYTEPAVLYPDVKYPALARQENMAGRVEFSLVIAEDAQVERIIIEAEEPGGFGFAEAILQARSDFEVVRASLRSVETPYILPLVATFGPNQWRVNIEKKSIAEIRQQKTTGKVTRPIFHFGPVGYEELIKTKGLPSGQYEFSFKVLSDGSITDVMLEEPHLEPGLYDELLEKFRANLTAEPALRDGKPIDYPGKLTLQITTKEEGIMKAGADGTVPQPKLVYRVEPEYPEAGRTARKGAVVEIQAIINPNGSVRSARVLKEEPEGFGFAEKALEAVRQWRFEPTTHKSKPVPVQIEFSVEFNILS